MEYQEAKNLLDSNDWLKSFGVHEREGTTAYPIEFKIIGVFDQIWEIKDQIDIYGFNNEQALVNLNLIDDNLRVYMVAKNSVDQWIIEDMYDYLKITSQLR